MTLAKSEPGRVVSLYSCCGRDSWFNCLCGCFDLANTDATFDVCKMSLGYKFSSCFGTTFDALFYEVSKTGHGFRFRIRILG